MKNRKWLTYTLGTLLTLVVLAVVAGASFRIGMMQNASFMHRPAFTNGFQPKPGTLPGNRDPQSMPGNPHDEFGGFPGMPGNQYQHGFHNRGNGHGGHGMFFFPPIFGIIHLLILALVIWVVYKLIEKSGWRLTRIEAPAVTDSESVDEIKGKKKRK
jgi:hypothetical protein